MNTNTSINLPAKTLQFILNTAQSVAHEHDIEGLCSALLQAALELTHADGGTLYLLNGSEDNPTLKHTLVFNQSLKINDNFFAGKHTRPEINLYNQDGSKNATKAASYACHYNQIINVSDIYATNKFDYAATKEFDQENNYLTKSSLTIPIYDDRNDKIVGVFQLVNAKDNNEICPFSKEHEATISIFAGFTASALGKQLLIDQQRNLLVELSTENSTQSLIERILREAKSFANADAGTLYLIKDINNQKQLSFELLVNDTLNLDSNNNPSILPENGVHLYLADGTENHANVAAACTHKKQTIVIENAYDTSDYDFTGMKTFDKQFKYHSQSFLVTPLLSHEGKVIGILQLINALDIHTGKPVQFSKRSVQLIKALANYAAIALNNQLLIQDLKNLLDAFIQCIAQAIDAKSPHTSAHCQRIPLLTEMIAQAACEDDNVFKDFCLTKDEWYELSVASWLHDCGKLATPDSVLDKSTKLHLMNDGIKIIEARFASLKQKAHSDYYQALANKTHSVNESKIALNNKLKSLDIDLKFIKACNKGAEFMAEEKKQRIRSIAKQTWTDAEDITSPLLDEEEVYNLCIDRGTLTPEERIIINNHMVVTLDMLESLPFPENLKRVPEIAGGHHERMDGTGFPRGLTRDQLSLPTRMMAVADVFEALTANDRPYKDPMKISTALKIMHNMVENNHLDPDIFHLFIHARVWEKYAISQLKGDQLDIKETPEF